MATTTSTPGSDQNRIRQTFEDLTSCLESAAADPKKNTVHHLRTNTRRVETLVQNQWPDGSEQKLLKQLKKLRRAAGAVRDVDVQTKLVDELESGESLRSRAFVRAQLDLRRADTEKQLIKLLSPNYLDQLLKLLKACERKLTRRHPTEVHDPVEDALQQYFSLTHDYESLDEKNLHEFRKACKHIRYLAELGAEGKRKQQVIENLKAIQDEIGDWHDLIALLDTASQALSKPKDSAFVAEVQARRDQQLQKALETCEKARQELARLELQVLSSSRKQPRSTSRNRRSATRRAS